MPLEAPEIEDGPRIYTWSLFSIPCPLLKLQSSPHGQGRIGILVLEQRYWDKVSHNNYIDYISFMAENLI